MTKWISVEKELPGIHEDVLAWSTIDGGGYVLATLESDERQWFCQPLFGVNYRTKSGISHWQRLPERIDV